MFDHILVPLDGSSLAECVLPHAVGLARAFSSRVTLLRAIERPASDQESQVVDPLSWHMRKTEAEVYLEEVVDRLMDRLEERATAQPGSDAPEFTVEQRIVEGEAAESIIAFAHQHDVDLIILSSHGRSGLSKWNINSVVQKVILRAYLPTLIVPAYPTGMEDEDIFSYQRVLVPLDCSPRAEYALPMASAIANAHGAQLIAAHVVTHPEMPRRRPLTQHEQELVNELIRLNEEAARAYLDDLQARMSLDNLDVRLITDDNPAEALQRLIARENIDLVLLTAHGYSGKAQWPYGSTALSFIAYGAVPQLILQDLTEESVDASPAERVVAEVKGH